MRSRRPGWETRSTACSTRGASPKACLNGGGLSARQVATWSGAGRWPWRKSSCAAGPLVPGWSPRRRYTESGDRTCPTNCPSGPPGGSGRIPDPPLLVEPVPGQRAARFRSGQARPARPPLTGTLPGDQRRRTSLRSSETRSSVVLLLVSEAAAIATLEASRLQWSRLSSTCWSEGPPDGWRSWCRTGR